MLLGKNWSVWKNNIPRMAFTLWLAIKSRLSTIDRMQTFVAHFGTGCVHCHAGMESHSHFFECSYSSMVQSSILSFTSQLWQPKPWVEFIDWAAINWKGKEMKNVIYKPCLASTVYYLWNERNNRKFKNQYRDPITVLNLIQQIIRNRLISLRFSSSAFNLQLLHKWRLPSGCLCQVVFRFARQQFCIVLFCLLTPMARIPYVNCLFYK